MIQLSLDKYYIIKYYGYTTNVYDRIVEAEYNYSSDKQSRLYEQLQSFWKELVYGAHQMKQRSLNDNKSAFKIRHKASGKELFIGQYDNNYSIGLSVKQRFGRSYDFATDTWSDYLSEFREDEDFEY